MISDSAPAGSRSQVPYFLNAEGTMAQFFQERDWSQHPLGRPENWDPALQSAVGLMLRSAFPQFIAWGPERSFLYNDAYRPILGSEKHPMAFGSPFEKAWADIWRDLEPVVKLVDQGRSSYFEDLPLLMNRNGYYEQTYFTFSYSPILNSSGQVGGLHCSCVETTARKNAEIALRESEERHRLTAEDALHKSKRLDAVISTMAEGVMFLDPTGRLLRMNDEALRLHGFLSNQDKIDQLDQYLERFELRSKSGNPVDYNEWPASRVIRGERFSGLEVKLFDRVTRKEIIASYGGAPVYDEDGKLTLVVLTIRDITEQYLAEERQQLIIETIPHGIWRTNPDGTADYISERFRKMVGYEREDLIGWGWAEKIHPDDMGRVLAEWQRCRDLSAPVHVEFRFLRKDGSYRWFLSIGNPFFDEDGKLTKYFGTWTDIQRERLARNELELFREALENSLNGFDIVNSEGKFDYVNRAYLNMWGYSDLKEVVGTSAIDHCVDPAIPLKIIEVLKERGECNIEFEARRKDGSVFDVNMWARLAHDSDGNEIYPTTSIDVTEQKKAEANLRMAKDDAERANQLKSAFLANMSHEIRTPLGAMIGFADLLRDPELSADERSNYIDILARNGEQLSVIINDILDLSKVEAGHLTLEFFETHPSIILADVISLLRIKAQEKDLYLEYKVDPNTPAEIVSDPTRVRQVLLNLISNSIKFTQAGGVRVRSYGGEDADGNQTVMFEIEDTGIGVAEEQKERIFEMFVQADGSMTRRFGGTGLGLSLSRKLARSLGGDVVVKETTVGKGTTFLFTVGNLPELRDSGITYAHPAELLQQLPKENSLKDVSILVVDDAPDNQHLIRRYLTKQGALVESAENGLEGFKKAIAGNFEIVLMDIQMPVMDGYSATQKLREHGYRKPIIALTAHAMSEVRRKCINIGCSDYLSKPINSKELIAAIARHTILS